MKNKTSELNQLEGLPDSTKPFNLKPVNLSELNLDTKISDVLKF